MRPERSAPFTLRRDCEVTLIPGGQRMGLMAGEMVLLTQSLGGTFTVQTEQGYLARIDAEDADVLGLEPIGGQEASEDLADAGPLDAGPLDAGPLDAGPFEIDQVIERLKTVFDPEIPVNVVDLGLIYTCDARLLPEGGHRVEIKMSMTAPGCGMGDILRQDAIARVRAVPGVSEVEVELVWDPPWDMSRMSEAARLQLGF